MKKFRIMRWVALVAILELIFGLKAWSQTPVPIIFDTDMADDCDDAGALAVLHALADLGEAEILATVTNRGDLSQASAAAVDVINTYYGRPDIPIGTDKDGAKIPDSRASSYLGALQKAFPHDALPDDQMPDALEVYRKTLAAQPDGSVVICSVGALSNLEDLIRSGPDKYSPLSGVELIRRKVKQTIIMGGGFPRTVKPETNIRLDPAAAVTVTNEWPGQISWQGFEVGAAIITGQQLQEVPPDNPVRRAFELRPYGGGFAIDRGKPSYDQAAVLLAVRGAKSMYWKTSGTGKAIIDSEGHTTWKSDEDGRQHYLHLNTHPEKLEEVISQLMTKKPKLR